MSRYLCERSASHSRAHNSVAEYLSLDLCVLLQLPKGWVRETDGKGKTYYYNKKTDESLHHPPTQRSALKVRR